MPSPTHRIGGYTSCLALPGMKDIPFLPLGWAFTLPSAPPQPPTPLPWTLKYQHEQWMYIDGSDIKVQPRLGDAMVHVPTCTTIYIDARTQTKTHNIMRMDLVAIHTALDKLAKHEWVGIFTDSLSSLQAIRHRYTNPRTRGPQDYQHHLLLLSRIMDLQEERHRQGLRTTLHKI